MTVAIIWFRRDLRTTDHEPLLRAVNSGLTVLPVYVIDELDSGSAQRWWLHHSLKSLDQALTAMGGGLRIAAGNPEELIPQLCEQVGASVVYCQHRYEAEAQAQLKGLRSKLPEDVRLNATHDYLVTAPGSVLTGGGTPFKVFTPFYRTGSAVDVEAPVDNPAPEFHAACQEVDEAALDSLLPTLDWADAFPKTWSPGEAGARQRLDEAVDKAMDYGELRDRPDVEGTSRLSPHIHFGEVGIRTVYHALQGVPGAEPLVRQLYWRDFSYHLLAENPDMGSEPLRREFANFPWVNDDALLKAWQKGLTGYPIVDAGMRQLWQTGWMHNRVRMIVASFLVKHLLIPWQHGADWFMDTLLDADLANNSAGWQWVAGCGTDASPYFRIFNPITQGKKFDPEGDYVREYVPELAKMPKKFIHDPWNADANILQASGVALGDNYPRPIVDHPEARQRALDAYQLSRDLLKSGAS